MKQAKINQIKIPVKNLFLSFYTACLSTVLTLLSCLPLSLWAASFRLPATAALAASARLTAPAVPAASARLTDAAMQAGLSFPEAILWRAAQMQELQLLLQSPLVLLPLCLLLQFLLLPASKHGWPRRFPQIVAALTTLAFPAVFRKGPSPEPPFADPNLLNRRAAMFLCLTVWCLCSVFSFLCRKAKEHFSRRILFTLVPLLCLILCSVCRIAVPKWCVCLSLSCFLLLLAETAERFRTKKAHFQSLYLLPFCLLFALALYLLPVKETPIQWKAVKQTAAYLQDRYHTLLLYLHSRFDGAPDTFALSFAGYAPGQKLGGSLQDSAGAEAPVQLKLVCAGTRSPLYLTGSVYDTYTGESWELSDTKLPYEGQEYLLQYRQLSRALSQSTLSAEEIQAVTHPFVIRIEFDGLKTKSLFYTPLTRTLKLPDNSSLDRNAGSRLQLRSVKGTGYDYTLNCMELNNGSEQIQALLRGQAWNPDKYGVAAPDAVLAARDAFIRKQYLRLPDTLPGRVRQLARTITADAQTDYDKLKAIEAYLHRFPYTVTPGSAPKGQDFTDYFLFGQQSGYCTYFATAMAVLGRCAGIPTRYVEGFRTDETCKAGARTTKLTGAAAHAWTEGYLDGVGWIPFEPTPGYAQELSGWAKASAGSSKAAEKDESPSSQEPSAKDIGEQDNGQTSAGSRNPWQSAVLAAAFLMAFCLFSAVFLAMRRLFLRSRYRRLDPHEKAKVLMRTVLSCAKLQRLSLQEGETLTAFSARTGALLNTPQLPFSQFCGLYQGARYSEAAVSAEDLKRMETYVQTLRQRSYHSLFSSFHFPGSLP